MLTQVNEFTNSNQIKLRGLQALCHTIVLAENNIKHHAAKIFRTLYKFYDFEDELVSSQVKVCGELMGIYIETDYYIPILTSDINDPDYAISPRLISNITNLLAQALQNENEQTMEAHLTRIVDLICKLENDFSDNT